MKLKKSLTLKVVLLVSAVFLIIFVPAFFLLWKNQNMVIDGQARSRALTLFQMIVITRQWVAENTHRVEPVPSVVTKELAQYADLLADFRFHITSDSLINPHNAPTPFEERALKSLKRGGKEYFERGIDPQLGHVYRYAAPLVVNASCITCHGEQKEYKLGGFSGIISIVIPLKDIEASVTSHNAAILTFVTAGVIVIMVIISFLLFKMVLSPIHILTDATEKLRSGEYVRTGIRTGDEIDELSQAFDMMSLQIAKNEEILKSKLAETAAKYTDLVDELKEKNDKLDTLNQLKTDLLDSIAHEIRTPLTKVLSYAELLVDPRLKDDEVERFKFAESLKRNVSSISSMFGDIITMSRLEHGQHTYHKIPIELKEFTENILSLHQSDIEAKSLRVDIEIKRGDTVLADGESFYYVMSNIISNALKYGKRGGHIRVALSKKAGEDEITVEDDGVGIPKEEIDRVCSRFRRGSNVVKEYPGTGLGLAIASRVVKEHDGALLIASELGQFTRVHITLPSSL